jgi:hypothetical protein
MLEEGYTYTLLVLDPGTPGQALDKALRSVSPSVVGAGLLADVWSCVSRSVPTLVDCTGSVNAHVQAAVDGGRCVH